MTQITASQVKDLREKTGLPMMKCKKALSQTDGDVDAAVELLRKEGAAVAAKRSEREANEGKVTFAITDSVVVAADINCETDFVAASDDFLGYADTVAKTIAANKPADVDTLMEIPHEGRALKDVQTDIIAKLGENITVKRFVVEDIADNEFAETYSHIGGKIGVVVKLSAADSLPASEELTNLVKDIAMQVAATNPIALDPEGVPADILEKEKEIYTEQAIAEGKPAEFAGKIVEGRINKYYKEHCLTKQIFVKDSKLSIEDLLAQKGKELQVKDLQVASYHRLQLGA
jgi:elongation factor Ts